MSEENKLVKNEEKASTKKSKFLYYLSFLHPYNLFKCAIDFILSIFVCSGFYFGPVYIEIDIEKSLNIGISMEYDIEYFKYFVIDLEIFFEMSFSWTDGFSIQTGLYEGLTYYIEFTPYIGAYPISIGKYQERCLFEKEFTNSEEEKKDKEEKEEINKNDNKDSEKDTYDEFSRLKKGNSDADKQYESIIVH